MIEANPTKLKAPAKAPETEVKNAPVKISIGKNFTLNELTVTKSGLPNDPGEKHVAALRALVENVLQPLRDHFNKPLQISSAFRSPAVNKAAGGAVNSQHLLGQAADIEIAGVPNHEIWHYIVDPKNKIQFDQCIAEHLSATDGKKGWIHVSFNPAQQRRSAISAVTIGGRTRYVPGLVFEA